MPISHPINAYYYSLSAAVALLIGSVVQTNCDAESLVDVVREVQPKLVKVYGAGGLRGMEAYQSGMLVSADGHVLTSWSYVLDTDPVVVLDDGRRYIAELVGADPIVEIAVLKIDAADEKLPHFNLAQSRGADVGDRVLAFSNLFNIATGDEPVSVLQGYIAAVAPLQARRGAFQSNYRGEVYIVDAATNNPGASGGALTDWQGHLRGLLGKELRSELTETWLNYALPTEAFAPSVEAIIAGQYTPLELTDADLPDDPLTLAELGIVLVPDVVARTPPYIDRVLPGSPAEAAGLRPDDLVVMLDSQVVTSIRQAEQLLQRYEFDAKVRVAVLRDNDLVETELQGDSETEWQ